MPSLLNLRLLLRLRRREPWPVEPGRLFLGLGLSLLIVGAASSCVAHPQLIEEAWGEAVRRSGFTREEIHPPQVIGPPPILGATPLPRDEQNRPIVAQYFPLSHQVRIYSRIAVPMRRHLLRGFLYAIYFDRLISHPLDVETLSSMTPAQEWVEQTMARETDPKP